MSECSDVGSPRFLRVHCEHGRKFTTVGILQNEIGFWRAHSEISTATVRRNVEAFASQPGVSVDQVMDQVKRQLDAAGRARSAQTLVYVGERFIGAYGSDAVKGWEEREPDESRREQIASEKLDVRCFVAGCNQRWVQWSHLVADTLDKIHNLGRTAVTLRELNRCSQAQSKTT